MTGAAERQMGRASVLAAFAVLLVAAAGARAAVVDVRIDFSDRGAADPSTDHGLAGGHCFGDRESARLLPPRDLADDVGRVIKTLSHWISDQSGERNMVVQAERLGKLNGLITTGTIAGEDEMQMFVLVKGELPRSQKIIDAFL